MIRLASAWSATIAWAYLIQISLAQPSADPILSLGDAREAHSLGDFRRAVDRASQAANLATGLGRQNLPTQAACSDVLADTLMASGQWVEAERAAARHLELIKLAASNSIHLQRSYARLGIVKAELGKREAARADYQHALRIPAGLRVNDPLWEPKILLQLAKVDPNGGSTQARQAADLLKPLLERYQEQRPDTDQLLEAWDLVKQVHLAAGTHRGAQEAIRQLAAWLDIANGDPKSHVRLLVDLADCHAAIDDWGAEEEFLSRAIDVLRTQPPDAASRLQIATLLARRSNLHEPATRASVASRDEALGILKELLTAAQNPAVSPASADLTPQFKMQCWELNHQLQQAAESWPEAIESLQQLYQLQATYLLDVDPRLHHTKALIGASLLCQEPPQPELAERWLEESLSFFDRYRQAWRALGEARPEIELDLAATRTNLALVHEKRGRYREALAQLKEAEAVYSRFGGNDLKHAECLVQLAGKEAALGDFVAAKEHYAKAVGIAQSIKPNEEVNDLITIALLNLAMLHKSQNQLAEALALCDQAIEKREERPGAKREREQIPYYLARASLCVARYQDTKATGLPNGSLLPRAMADIDSAIELLTAYRLEESAQAADVYHTKALALYFLDRRDQAELQWREARRIAVDGRRATIAVRSLNYLVDIEFQRAKERLNQRLKYTREDLQQELAQAELLSREAYERQQSVLAYPAVQFIVLMNRAQILHALDQNDEASQLLKDAIAALETPRAFTTGAEQERASYFAQFQMAYHLLIDWSCQRPDKQTREALIACDLHRNRTFLDQVRAAGIDLQAGIRADLIAEHNRMAVEYNRASLALRRADTDLHAPGVDSSGVEQLQALKEQYGQLEIKIREASPAYRKLRAPVTWSETGAAIDRLVTEKNFVLFYYVGAVRSRVFLAWRPAGQPHPTFEEQELKLSPEAAQDFGVGHERDSSLHAITLERLVRRAVQSISQVHSASGALLGEQDLPFAEPRLTDGQLRTLSQILLPEPVQARISELNRATITVIPDGSLQQLPFEALQVRGKYVLDMFPPLHYFPSANIAHLVMDHHSGSARSGFLTVAPRYQGEVWPLTSGKAWTLHPLKHAENESREVQIALHKAGLPGMQLLGEKADLASVAAALPGKRVIHLAAHGLVDQHPGNLFGAIALSASGDFREDTGSGFLLHLAAISRLNLSGCELVALSACQTNCGPNQPLEAGMSLARSFFAAGAERVVSSHWDVDDAATAKLMAMFFHHVADSLAAGRPPDYALSLLTAKRAVRSTEEWAKPKYWAPLVLVGSAQGEPRRNP